MNYEMFVISKSVILLLKNVYIGAFLNGSVFKRYVILRKSTEKKFTGENKNKPFWR